MDLHGSDVLVTLWQSPTTACLGIAAIFVHFPAMRAGCELVKTIEIGDSGQHGGRSFDVVLRVYRDLARGDFFARVSRRKLLRVLSSMRRVADEEIEIVDRSFARDALRAMTAKRVTQSAMQVLRHVKAAKGRHRRSTAAELVRTVELGPYDVPGETPMLFVVKVYKRLDKQRTFFPIVFRRDSYLLKPSFRAKAKVEEVEVVDFNYDAESFERKSAAASLAASVGAIRKAYEAHTSSHKRA